MSWQQMSMFPVKWFPDDRPSQCIERIIPWERQAFAQVAEAIYGYTQAHDIVLASAWHPPFVIPWEPRTYPLTGRSAHYVYRGGLLWSDPQITV